VRGPFYLRYKLNFRSHIGNRCKHYRTNMRNLVLIIAVALFNLLPAARADEKLIPSVNTPKLSVIESKGEKVEGNSVSFDFGEWPIWDNSLEEAAWRGVDSRTLWKGLPKVKVFHTFTLQNETNETIVATAFKVEGNIEEIKSPDLGDFPFKIAPNKKVTLQIYFAYQNLFPGALTGSVQLMGSGSKTPLVTMNLSSRVTTGIVVQPTILNFGDVLSGEETVREFSVTFDRRMTNNLSSIPVKFFCKNPALKIQYVPLKQELKGIKIEKDVITFPQHDKEFHQDITLKFTATLSKDAPVGVIDEHIRLIAIGFPMLSIVKGVQTRAQGRVVAKNAELQR
jgi:hypothetical protein